MAWPPSTLSLATPGQTIPNSHRNDVANALNDLVAEVGVHPRGFLVTKYGAVADGVTNCQPAFVSAVAAATAAGGGIVVLPEATGSFKVTGYVDFPGNVGLVGPGNVTILLGSAASGLRWGDTVTSGRQTGEVGGFKVECNNVAPVGIYVGIRVGGIFHHIEIYNATTAGLLMQGTQNTLFSVVNTTACRDGRIFDLTAATNVHLKCEDANSKRFGVVFTMSGPMPALFGAGSVPCGYNVLDTHICEPFGGTVLEAGAASVYHGAGLDNVFRSSVIATGVTIGKLVQYEKAGTFASIGLRLDGCNLAGNGFAAIALNFGAGVTGYTSGNTQIVGCTTGVTIDPAGFLWDDGTMFNECATKVSAGSVFTADANVQQRSRHAHTIKRHVNTDSAVNVWVDGDTAYRLRLMANGDFVAGSGAAAEDTTWGRVAADCFGTAIGDSIRPGRAVTASRPSAVTVGAGAIFYDTTLSKPIFSDGAVWRDADSVAV